MQVISEATVEWAPPGPGPWQQDSAHNPVAQTLVMQMLYPPGFIRGFAETFSRYGLLLDGLAIAAVNGFSYHQPRPFDLPGPGGPPSPEYLGAEVARRAQVAGEAWASRLWRTDLAEWDSFSKPAAIARHRELGDVDLGELDDVGLADHVRACGEHVEAMAYQHHRYNMAALLPVGDFLVQGSSMLRRPPTALLGVLDGSSPVSGSVSPEMVEALEALRADVEARSLLSQAGDPAERLAALRARLPEVDEYVRSVGFRLIEGFDVTNPTQLERSAILLGKLAAALDADPETGRRRADELADSLRSELGEGDRRRFDELLTEARLVYRLRDERGLYSDVSAIGLLRLALLEVGRRGVDAGMLSDPSEALDATIDEAVGILSGTGAPGPGELAARAARRRELSAVGAPRYLGPPPPQPPPVDQLPPPLARVMAATGLVIEGVLGQLEEPAGDGALISGIPASSGVSEGRACLVHDADDLTRLEQGDILVSPTTGEAVNSVLHLLAGIVTDHGSFASHAGIVAREMGFPAVVGTVNATRRIRDGARIRVDGRAGVVTLLE